MTDSKAVAPTAEDMRWSINWLESYELGPDDQVIADTIARMKAWLEKQADLLEFRQACKEAGVSVSQARAAMDAAKRSRREQERAERDAAQTLRKRQNRWPLALPVVIDDAGQSLAELPPQPDDCMARAIAIASGRPFAEPRKALSAASEQLTQTYGKDGAALARAKRAWFFEYMASLGFSWVPTMGIVAGSATYLEDGELPNGRLVVIVGDWHYTALIDGVIHDAGDPYFQKVLGDGEVYGYWRLDPASVAALAGTAA